MLHCYMGTMDTHHVNNSDSYISYFFFSRQSLQDSVDTF